MAWPGQSDSRALRAARAQGRRSNPQGRDDHGHRGGFGGCVMSTNLDGATIGTVVQLRWKRKLYRAVLKHIEGCDGQRWNVYEVRPNDPDGSYFMTEGRRIGTDHSFIDRWIV